MQRRPWCVVQWLRTEEPCVHGLAAVRLSLFWSRQEQDEDRGQRSQVRSFVQRYHFIWRLRLFVGRSLSARVYVKHIFKYSACTSHIPKKMDAQSSAISVKSWNPCWWIIFEFTQVWLNRMWQFSIGWYLRGLIQPVTYPRNIPSNIMHYIL